MPAIEVVIVPYRDGPLLVRGPAELRDQSGRKIDPGRETFALCRCGKSRLRPFCDGSHRAIRFQAPSEREQRSSGEPAPVPRSETETIRRTLAGLERRLARLAKTEPPATALRLSAACELVAEAATRLGDDGLTDAAAADGHS